MEKKIVLAGGTGFVGKFLAEKYSKLGYKILIISRQQNCISWDNENAIIEAIDNSEFVINLAGRSVNCRYNQKNKDEILKSRVETTKIIGNAILKCKNPPELWLNSSTATIYKYSLDKPMTETDGILGEGFSVEVAKSWEKAFFDFDLQSIRRVALRITIVLGKNGGVMEPFVKLVKFGLGGKQGNGKQMFSWIHIEDLFKIIQFVQSNKNIKGAINCASPNPVTNNDLMKTLRKVMNKSFGLPSPKWILEVGAIFIRTETELILKSRYVVSDKLNKEGFIFKYPILEDAFKNLLIEK